MNNDFRSQFPILRRKIKGKTCVFLDGPAGTQVPESVIRSISQYYRRSNSNTHGHFTTTLETDQLLNNTRADIAAFLGASSGDNISFGQNMTSLNYSLSRAIGRYFNKGDEILITHLDHESNRGPWLALRSQGIRIRKVRIKNDGTLDYNDFKKKINNRTRMVCMGLASNLTGAVNDVKLVRKLTYDVGAWLLLDAVHYAPHFKINVSEIGCDFLLCSAYKFYGPHVGMLYSKKGLLDRLPTDRLRTSAQEAPYSIETGTLNHAAIAGVKGAIEFISKIGEGEGLNDKLVSAMKVIGKHEKKMAKNLHSWLSKNKNFEIVGPEFTKTERSPTLSFIHKKKTAKQICVHLSESNIFAWSGHFYAIKASEVLGLEERGGVTRMGISAYTNQEDLERTIESLESL